MNASGFPMVAQGDLDTLARASFLYDALYASIQARLSKRGSPTSFGDGVALRSSPKKMKDGL